MGRSRWASIIFLRRYEKEIRRCEAVARLQHNEATLACIGALLAYRLKEYEDALSGVDLSSANSEHTHSGHQEASLLIRSLGKWQLGNRDDAQSLFQQARKLRETEGYPQPNWELDVQLLSQEVMSLHHTEL